ncbi:MAG: carboxylesterase family protein [Dehalococcoidia bacterium]
MRFHKPVITLLAGLLLLSLAAACSSDEKTTALPEASPSPSVTQAPAPEALPAWTGSPTVSTKYGAVRGFEDEHETWVWKAIPYAMPPVKGLRWRAPIDPAPWNAVMEADSFCQMCPQYDPLLGEDIWGDEDCLYLNIWRPQSDETDLPVYVWIHGGGNSIGSANQTPTYMGASLARKSNMIFVSMNYRLGPLGWFTHPALGEGDELDDSGNYGTLDTIKALQWIQENIRAFGGNPDKVIITGESAGAVNVFALMMSPAAKGLFSRAMAQSGMTTSVPMEEGEASAEEVMLNLLQNDGTAATEAEAETCLEAMTDAEIRSYLYSKTPQELFACYEQKGFGLITFPNIFQDGEVIVSEGVDSFNKGTYPNKVPLILGSNKEELKMFLFLDEELVAQEELYQTVTSYGSKLWKINGVDDVARKLTAAADQPDVYAYQFNWGAYQPDGSSPIPAPYDLKIGAAHSLDNPFFLGNPSFNVFMTNWVFSAENQPGREALTNAMMGYVARFVRTGNPNDPGSNIPEWKPWSNVPGEPKCILFDADLEKARIGMSSRELTVAGVMEEMKEEIPEPLYSQAIEYILSQWTVSHLLEGGG